MVLPQQEELAKSKLKRYTFKLNKYLYIGLRLTHKLS